MGRITIETSNTVLDEGYCAGRPEFVPGEYVLLAVSDDGCGMGEEVLQCVFEPFFTTKEMGRGTGLGLATVYGIVRQNLGFVNVYSEPGRGATFKIYLPKFEGEAVEIPVEKPAESLPTGVETVLIVEDEEAIMQLRIAPDRPSCSTRSRACFSVFVMVIAAPVASNASAISMRISGSSSTTRIERPSKVGRRM